MNYINYIFNPVGLKNIKKLNWKDLWIKKSDYIQGYYLKIKGKYKIVDESINYYITMIEMAIYYLKDYDNYYDYFYKQHIIVFDGLFFDKNYFKEDVKERDFAEYLKYLFVKGNYDLNDIYNLLEKGRKFNYDLVVARLLFPSYYIFYLEKFLLYHQDSELVNIISRSSEYEEYIKKIVNKINEFKVKKIILPLK